MTHKPSAAGASCTKGMGNHLKRGNSAFGHVHGFQPSGSQVLKAILLFVIMLGRSIIYEPPNMACLKMAVIVEWLMPQFCQNP